MSVLVTTRRSATADCFEASGIVSSCPMPFTASTRVTTPFNRYCAPRKPSVCSVCSTGTGSASPVVSTSTRSKSITSPARRLTKSSRSVSCRSVRSVQHRHPLPRSVTCSEDAATSSWSSATSPNSLITTAARFIPGWRSSRRNRVVFPLPRNPVMIVTGSRLASGSAALTASFRGCRARRRSDRRCRPGAGRRRRRRSTAPRPPGRALARRGRSTPPPAAGRDCSRRRRARPR